MRFRWDV